MEVNQLDGLGAQPGPLADAVAAARVAMVAMAAVDAHRAAGLSVRADYMAERGDVGMDAAAALRRLLAEIDRQPAARPALTAGDLGVLGQALADAIAYREPSWSCPDCDMHPGELCPDHIADQAMTNSYLALAGSLGLEAGSVSAYTSRAVAAITQAARSEHDFAGWLARCLTAAAGQLGGSDALVEGRPGSWEADLVMQLVHGTAGHSDEYLPAPAGRAKLTDAKVRAIRWRYDDGYGEVTQRELAAEFGISASTVSDITAGKTWRWLA